MENLHPVEFTLTIKKASHDPNTGEYRWRADTSDTEEDLYGDRMSLGLFQDFLSRIVKKEVPPKEFCTDFWSGGMPYLSVSHYPDMNGKAVPGSVDDVFIDGRFFKARGRFSNDPLGMACWKAIKSDLEKKSTGVENDPVRISIAFLDFAHRHIDTGTVFERSFGGETPSICVECMKAKLDGNPLRLEYLKGLLVHLAMTRVPVNQRTIMEVDKSMAEKIKTRKDDAASIVGPEMADELEKEAALVGKSETLVIRSDDEEYEKEPETDEPKKDEPDVMGQLAMIANSLNQLNSAFMEFVSTMKAVPAPEPEPEPDEPEDEPKVEERSMADALVVALSEVMAPMVQRLDMLVSASQNPVVKSVESPARRSISPATVQQVTRSNTGSSANSGPISIAEFTRKSVGIE